MINGLYGMYNAYSAYGATGAYSANQFDYRAAQQKLKSAMENKANDQTVKALKKDTANFLDVYTKDMEDMKKSADALTGNKLQELLYGKGGSRAEAPTAENVKKATDAVQNLVDSYNNALTTLNKNADRGPGVISQIARMAQSPAPEKSMALAGITVNKDGTLALDTEKLTAALSGSEAQRSLTTDIIGGSFGIAGGVRRDADAGLGQSPGSLIANDLQEIKGIQDSYQSSILSAMGTGGGSFSALSMYSRSGAYNMMNMGMVGMLMNVLV